MQQAPQSIKAMWAELQSVDLTLTPGDKVTKDTLESKPALKEFLAHCCLQHKYMFQVKCESLTCNNCKPPQLTTEVFDHLKFLPDPVPGQEGHYKPVHTSVWNGDY